MTFENSAFKVVTVFINRDRCLSEYDLYNNLCSGCKRCMRTSKVCKRGVDTILMSADGNRFECAKWQKSTSWKDGLTKAEVRKEEQARKESEERRKAFINFMRTGRVGFEDYLKYGLDGPSNEELLDKEINDAGKTNVHSGEILIPEELEKEIMRALPSLTIMRGICKNQPGMERMKYIDE